VSAVLPFLVSGVVIGSLYALSGVGMLVLYRTTGVLNFAYGALGATAGMAAWQLVEMLLQPLVALLLGVLAAAALSLLFGVVAGPALARTAELGKATATLGLALALLGTMYTIWNDKARTLRLATDSTGFDAGGARVTATQVLSLVLVAVVVAATSVFLQRSGAGTAMRALAGDRELSAMLGVRVRRVELMAWATSGALAGISGLLLAAQTQLEPGYLTFLVGLLAGVDGLVDPVTFPASQSILLFATVLVGGAFSLWGALIAGFLIQGVPRLLSEIGVSGNLVFVILGLATVQAIITSPDGAAGQLGRLFARIGGRPRPGPPEPPDAPADRGAS